MEESVELPWRGTVTCKPVFGQHDKTISLFTRFGSWSVRRRTNRVFPKPPLFEDTTRTQSLGIIKAKFKTSKENYNSQPPKAQRFFLNKKKKTYFSGSKEPAGAQVILLLLMYPYCRAEIRNCLLRYVWSSSGEGQGGAATRYWSRAATMLARSSFSLLQIITKPKSTSNRKQRSCIVYKINSSTPS